MEAEALAEEIAWSTLAPDCDQITIESPQTSPGRSLKVDGSPFSEGIKSSFNLKVDTNSNIIRKPKGFPNFLEEKNRNDESSSNNSIMSLSMCTILLLILITVNFFFYYNITNYCLVI